MKVWTSNRSNNVHTRWKALAEIYTMHLHSFAPFWTVLVGFVIFSSKIGKLFAKFCKIKIKIKCPGIEKRFSKTALRGRMQLVFHFSRLNHQPSDRNPVLQRPQPFLVSCVSGFFRNPPIPLVERKRHSRCAKEPFSSVMHAFIAPIFMGKLAFLRICLIQRPSISNVIQVGHDSQLYVPKFWKNFSTKNLENPMARSRSRSNVLESRKGRKQP